jgi:uncharacterized protein (DUF1810 family)
MATAFGIVSRQEAAAYLDHPVLGPRLRECTRLVNLVGGRSISQILGYPDDLKFRSSMTLFASVAPDDQVFKDALHKYLFRKRRPNWPTRSWRSASAQDTSILEEALNRMKSSLKAA